MGLGLRRLLEFNAACMAKLAVEFLNNKKDWTEFIRRRFYRRGVAISYYSSSSIWKGVKSGLQMVALDINWLVGRQ